MSIVSLILSAGESSRMGEPKALLEWKGKTFLAHAAQAARNAGISKIIVVVGAHAAEILPEAICLGIAPVVNENWRLGMGASIKKGLTSIQQAVPDVSAILIQLSDQPKIDATALSKLISEYRNNPQHIVSAKYENSPGVPAIFPKIFFQEILDIRDDEGAKKILLNKPEVVKSINMIEARDDIDTPEQLLILRKLN